MYQTDQAMSAIDDSGPCYSHSYFNQEQPAFSQSTPCNPITNETFQTQGPRPGHWTINHRALSAIDDSCQTLWRVPLRDLSRSPSHSSNSIDPALRRALRKLYLAKAARIEAENARKYLSDLKEPTLQNHHQTNNEIKQNSPVQDRTASKKLLPPVAPRLKGYRIISKDGREKKIPFIRSIKEPFKEVQRLQTEGLVQREQSTVHQPANKSVTKPNRDKDENGGKASLHIQPLGVHWHKPTPVEAHSRRLDDQSKQSAERERQIKRAVKAAQRLREERIEKEERERSAHREEIAKRARQIDKATEAARRLRQERENEQTANEILTPAAPAPGKHEYLMSGALPSPAVNKNSPRQSDHLESNHLAGRVSSSHRPVTSLGHSDNRDGRVSPKLTSRTSSKKSNNEPDGLFDSPSGERSRVTSQSSAPPSRKQQQPKSVSQVPSQQWQQQVEGCDEVGAGLAYQGLIGPNQSRSSTYHSATKSNPNLPVRGEAKVKTLSTTHSPSKAPSADKGVLESPQSPNLDLSRSKIDQRDNFTPSPEPRSGLPSQISVFSEQDWNEYRQSPTESKPTIYAGRGWISPHPLSVVSDGGDGHPETEIRLPCSDSTGVGEVMTIDEWQALHKSDEMLFTEDKKVRRNFSRTSSGASARTAGQWGRSGVGKIIHSNERSLRRDAFTADNGSEFHASHLAQNDRLHAELRTSTSQEIYDLSSQVSQQYRSSRRSNLSQPSSRSNNRYSWGSSQILPKSQYSTADFAETKGNDSLVGLKSLSEDSPDSQFVFYKPYGGQNRSSSETKQVESSPLNRDKIFYNPQVHLRMPWDSGSELNSTSLSSAASDAESAKVSSHYSRLG